MTFEKVTGGFCVSVTRGGIRVTGNKSVTDGKIVLLLSNCLFYILFFLKGNIVTNKKGGVVNILKGAKSGKKGYKAPKKTKHGEPPSNLLPVTFALVGPFRRAQA